MIDLLDAAAIIVFAAYAFYVIRIMTGPVPKHRNPPNPPEKRRIVWRRKSIK